MIEKTIVKTFPRTESANSSYSLEIAAIFENTDVAKK